MLLLALGAAPSLPSLFMSLAGLVGGAALPPAAAALVASGTAWIQKKDSKSGPSRSVGSIARLCADARFRLRNQCCRMKYQNSTK